MNTQTAQTTVPNAHIDAASEIPLPPGRDRDRPEKATTPLQGHAGFFDRDHDGIIWPTDTSVAL